MRARASGPARRSCSLDGVLGGGAAALGEGGGDHSIGGNGSMTRDRRVWSAEGLATSHLGLGACDVWVSAGARVNFTVNFTVKYEM